MATDEIVKIRENTHFLGYMWVTQEVLYPNGGDQLVRTRNCWRIRYTITLRDKKARRALYAKVRAEANTLETQLSLVEQHTRTGVATQQQIEEWIERGWLTQEQAEIAFAGYAESADRKRLQQPQDTDYGAIHDAYEEYVANTSKGGRFGRNFSNNMSQARMVIAWLKQDCPSLPALTREAIISHLFDMKGSYSESSIRHFLIKLQLLLNHAVTLGMTAQNPARGISLRRDLNLRLKASRSRRILTAEEAKRLLDVSLDYPQYLNGGLPSLVRLGLYAGLRNEEMCWLKWQNIDFEQRIISVQETTDEVTGESWVPKDFEARRIDVKESCIEFLEQELQRQNEIGTGSPFVLPCGRTIGSKDPVDRRKHLYPTTPSKSFAKMIRDEKWDERITVYSLRHTYATMALRSSIDLSTLQKRMGHADLKTTMEYLHFIEPEQHPMDALPY